MLSWLRLTLETPPFQMYVDDIYSAYNDVVNISANGALGATADAVR